MLLLEIALGGGSDGYLVSLFESKGRGDPCGAQSTGASTVLDFSFATAETSHSKHIRSYSSNGGGGGCNTVRLL